MDPAEGQALVELLHEVALGRVVPDLSPALPAASVAIGDRAPPPPLRRRPVLDAQVALATQVMNAKDYRGSILGDNAT